MIRILLTAVLLLSLAACASKNRFVLLEEEDGSVGAITIVNDAGSQTVTEAGNATMVGSPTAPPSRPEALNAGDIQQTWGAAVAASPLKPRSFLLYFLTGTDILTEDSRRQLPEIVASLKEYPAPEVAVIGHTDTVDSAARNERLAQSRAETIRNLLIGQGLAPSLIEVSSHGESNLLIPTPDNVDEPRNRRVEVTVR